MAEFEKLVIDGVPGLRALIGKELPPGPWHPLRFEEIVAFADATDDHQWIHVDRERIARESPFGTPIAHGYYSVARIAGLFFETLELAGVGMVVNYGLNRVRFPAPLPVDSAYRLRMRVDEVEEIRGGVQVVFHCVIDVQDQGKPCLVADAVYRILDPA
jgi:acyl dehydratase